MCDTQVLITDAAVWFAKNSDREPSEPQPVVRFAAVRGDATRELQTTYLRIAQVPDRQGLILSKPAWCWGAEMGVNDAGVAIGNEAIFSRWATLKPALLGMDLVRLGLERSGSAAEAVEVMAALLQQHGQGGAAGYADRRFCYDNSFLIADAREAWVLETAGRDWVRRRVDRTYAISNQLTLAQDWQAASAGIVPGTDFARRHDTRLLPWLARARRRRALAISALVAEGQATFARFAAQLRGHGHDGEDPAHGSNGDLCMHAAGFIRRHQTTGSMIVRLAPCGATMLVTGTSAPCLSIFRPVGFDGTYSALTAESEQVAASLWRRHEWLHRWALADAGLRQRLRATRDVVEQQIFALLAEPVVSSESLARADRLAAAWHKVLWESLHALPPPRLSRHWQRIAARDGIDPGRALQGAGSGYNAGATLTERDR